MDDSDDSSLERLIQDRWQKIMGAHVMQVAAQQVRIEQLQARLARYEAEEKAKE